MRLLIYLCFLGIKIFLEDKNAGSVNSPHLPRSPGRLAYLAAADVLTPMPKLTARENLTDVTFPPRESCSLIKPLHHTVDLCNVFHRWGHAALVGDERWWAAATAETASTSNNSSNR